MLHRDKADFPHLFPASRRLTIELWELRTKLQCGLVGIRLRCESTFGRVTTGNQP
jgi:hypothetical protein